MVDIELVDIKTISIYIVISVRTNDHQRNIETSEHFCPTWRIDVSNDKVLPLSHLSGGVIVNMEVTVLYIILIEP